MSLVSFSMCVHRWKDSNAEGVAFSDMDELEEYAAYAHSSILYLTLELLGIKDEKAAYIASHVGVSLGICSLLRGFPHHSANVRVIMVQDRRT